MVESPLHFIKPREPKPEWLKVRAPGSENYLRLRGIMRDLKLNTVCEDAHCPNIGECWHHGTATFMILGDICTRACAYCAVAHGKPATLDIDEPRRVGEAVEKMALKYAVITSVDRDDLPDGGAGDLRRDDPRHQAAAARVPRRSADPRLQGRGEPLEIVLDARPDVLNHNTETVPRLYRAVRSGGTLLAHAGTARSLAHHRAGDPDQDRHDDGPRRRAGRSDRGVQGPAQGRRLDPDARPVPAPVRQPRGDDALLPSRMSSGS